MGSGHSDTKINQIFLRNGVGTSAKPLPYAIAASITADLKQLLLAFPLPFHKLVVCLLRAGGEGRYGELRWLSEGMVPKSSRQIRKWMGRVKLGQPDMDRRGFVIPDKKRRVSLGCAWRAINRDCRVEPKGIFLETPAGEGKGVSIKALTPSS